MNDRSPDRADGHAATEGHPLFTTPLVTGPLPDSGGPASDGGVYPSPFGKGALSRTSTVCVRGAWRQDEPVAGR